MSLTLPPLPCQHLTSLMSYDKDICVEDAVNVSSYIEDLEDDQRDETEDDERSSMSNSVH